MDELGRSSGEIGRILTVIDEVSDETHLLTLNASILASQAGEYGKGFGVVAEEIKGLAERTASSTKEIEALINSVQSQTQRAIASVKTTRETVDEGERLSLETITTLTSILERFKKSHEMSQLIARATQEEVKGSNVVADSLRQIKDSVSLQRKNFEGIVETINKTQEIMRENQEGVERLNKIVTELREGVYALNEGMRSFKLENL